MIEADKLVIAASGWLLTERRYRELLAKPPPVMQSADDEARSRKARAAVAMEFGIAIQNAPTELRHLK